MFVGSPSGVTAFEIGTGQQTRPFALTEFGSPIISNGSLLFSITSVTNQIRSYNLTTGTTLGLSGPADVTMLQLVNRGLATSISYGRDSSNRLVTQVMSSAGAVSGPTTLTGISGTFTMGSVTHFAGQDFFIIRDAANTRLYRGTGTSYSFSAANLNSLFSTTASTPSVVAGHENLYVIGESSTTGRTRIVRFGVSATSGSTLLMNNFEVNFTPEPGMNAGIVVAPEPGTMLALGAGLAAVLRRRKSRNK